MRRPWPRVPQPVRVVRAAAEAPNAGRILRDDVYGWFERVDRGVYALTPKGTRGGRGRPPGGTRALEHSRVREEVLRIHPADHLRRAGPRAARARSGP